MSLQLVKLVVEPLELDELPSCDAIVDTLHDGIHDKTCGITAHAAISGDETGIRLCTTHLSNVVRYVVQTGQVPERWNAQTGTPWNRVNIEGGEGDCDCENCT